MTLFESNTFAIWLLRPDNFYQHQFLAGAGRCFYWTGPDWFVLDSVKGPSLAGRDLIWHAGKQGWETLTTLTSHHASGVPALRGCCICMSSQTSPLHICWCSVLLSRSQGHAHTPRSDQSIHFLMEDLPPLAQCLDFVCFLIIIHWTIPHLYFFAEILGCNTLLKVFLLKCGE